MKNLKIKTLIILFVILILSCIFGTDKLQAVTPSSVQQIINTVNNPDTANTNFTISNYMYRTWQQLNCADVGAEEPDEDGNFRATFRTSYGDGLNTGALYQYLNKGAQGGGLENDFIMAYVLWKADDPAWEGGKHIPSCSGAYYAPQGVIWSQLKYKVILQPVDQWGNCSEGRIRGRTLK